MVHASHEGKMVTPYLFSVFPFYVGCWWWWVDSLFLKNLVFTAAPKTGKKTWESDTTRATVAKSVRNVDLVGFLLNVMRRRTWFLLNIPMEIPSQIWKHLWKIPRILYHIILYIYIDHVIMYPTRETRPMENSQQSLTGLCWCWFLIEKNPWPMSTPCPIHCSGSLGPPVLTQTSWRFLNMGGMPETICFNPKSLVMIWFEIDFGGYHIFWETPGILRPSKNPCVSQPGVGFPRRLGTHAEEATVEAFFDTQYEQHLRRFERTVLRRTEDGGLVRNLELISPEYAVSFLVENVNVLTS